ncbi:MAG: hypothetical protein KF699_03600 [Phycisphaeraceae bacterium]|nr:hypothetical protein [Phycisphaeraceae bacterium]MBX3405592.1 hypothetical protein [Phycisphaeraceae bacterium]
MTVHRPLPAFTLIESLLACALVAVLVALLLPSIADVRHRSRRLVSASNLRSHATIFGSYVTDWRDTYPYFTSPNATASVVRNPSREIALVVPYFGAHFTWHVALADGYFAGDHTSKAFRPPGREDVRPGYTAYWYPCTFIAAPAFWRYKEREGPHQRVPTRTDQVLFPSAKALLVESDIIFPDQVQFVRPRVLAATVDGAAQERPSTQLIGSWYISGDGPWHGAMHGTWWPTLHHTIGGVTGRDFR